MPKACGAVTHELVELHERAGIEEHVDAFPRGHLAARVLLLDRGFAARRDRLVVPILQVRQLPAVVYMSGDVSLLVTRITLPVGSVAARLGADTLKACFSSARRP